MAVIPVVFNTTKQDVRVISAMCDSVLGIYGAEKRGTYSIVVRFYPSSVSMALSPMGNYKAPKEKIMPFENSHGSKLYKFFKDAGDYWSGRDEGPNVAMIDVEYVCSDDGKIKRVYRKLDFFNINNIVMHKAAEIVPWDLVI